MGGQRGSNKTNQLTNIVLKRAIGTLRMFQLTRRTPRVNGLTLFSGRTNGTNVSLWARTARHGPFALDEWVQCERTG